MIAPSKVDHPEESGLVHESKIGRKHSMPEGGHDLSAAKNILTKRWPWVADRSAGVLRQTTYWYRYPRHHSHRVSLCEEILRPLTSSTTPVCVILRLLILLMLALDHMGTGTYIFVITLGPVVAKG